MVRLGEYNGRHERLVGVVVHFLPDYG
jgi:hypothetical protein